MNDQLVTTVQPGGYLDQFLHIPPPPAENALDTTAPPEYHAGRLRGLIEGLAGLAAAPMHTPRSFGEGLVTGLARGLGVAGQREHEARLQFNTAMQERQKTRDAEHLTDVREYNAERRSKLKEEEDKVLLSPDMLKGAPPGSGLNRLAGQKVSRSFYQSEMAQQPKEKPYDQMNPAEQKTYLAGVSAKSRAEAAGTSAGNEDWLNHVDEGTKQGLAKNAAAGLPLSSMGLTSRSVAGVKLNLDIMGRALKINPDLAGNFAGYKADAHALSGRVNDLSSTDAFAGLLKANVGVAHDWMKKLPDTGSPWLNRPLRDFYNAFGNQDVAPVRLAVSTVVREYTKLTSSASGGGVSEVPQKIQEDMKKIVSGDATLGTFLNVARVMEQDALNKHNSYSAEIKAIGDRIGKREKGEAVQSSVGRYNPATGQIERY